MTSRLKLLLALFAVIMLTAGCASIPAQTRPEAIQDANAATDSGDEPVAPEADLDPGGVVRAMIGANADQRRAYVSSKLYMSQAFARKWHPGGDLMIINKSFDAVTATDSSQPLSADEQLVEVKGIKRGTLKSDGSFVPDSGEFRMNVLLRQDKAKQWRVVNMPDVAVTSADTFSDAFSQVTLQYFAPESDVTVPDPRWIAVEPASGEGGRVISALMDGPSDSIAGAVRNPLSKAQLDTNVTMQNGVLQVPLTGLSDVDNKTKQDIVTQIVASLRFVGSNTPVSPRSDDKPILPNRENWYYSQLGQQGPDPRAANSDGMAIIGNQIVSLSNGRPLRGPSGAGAYDVATAAQSWETNELAVVEHTGRKEDLRIGQTEGALTQTSIAAKTMTRPTWSPAVPGNKVANEVWTVLDGKKVVRATLTQDNAWVQQPVNTSELGDIGKITALRLSQDGTRAALIAGGKLVVAAVVRTDQTVQLRAPRILQPNQISHAVDVDWLAQDSLVVANRGAAAPVMQVSVDGYQSEAFNKSNLQDRADSIAANPGGTVIAANGSGLSSTSGPNDIWRTHPQSQTGIRRPFFPG